MAQLPTNKCAPELPLELSKETAAAVLEMRHTRGSSAYATPDGAAIRREPARDAATPMRPSFSRDIDKILHLPAYNRLAGKTQVFSFFSNDDITRRGLHVQLVGRIADEIGRSLGLNLDLIEAIALGHDIGHTPFGHAGERYLNDIYHERTGRWFFHNVQSVRVLDVLYGRNLALQTLDGVICHNGEFEQQVFETSDIASFDDFDQMVEGCWAEGPTAIGRLRPMTLEGCVVRVSDIIAYVGKDRQDAIRARHADESTFDDGLGSAYNSWAIDAFTTDVVEHSFGKSKLEMSEAAFAELSRAKGENYHKIYLASEVDEVYSEDLRELFGGLYEQVLSDVRAGREDQPVFKHHIRPLTEHLAHYGKSYDWQSDADIVAVDYISSMTDEYFMAICEHLFPGAEKAFPWQSWF